MSETAVDRVLRLHPLTFLADGDDVVIGRVDIDSYAVFPPDGAALIRHLSDGALSDGARGKGVTPVDAAAWYEQTYGEPVDLEGFLDTLDELGFIAGDADDEPAGVTQTQVEPHTQTPGRLRWQPRSLPATRSGRALRRPGRARRSRRASWQSPASPSAPRRAGPGKSRAANAGPTGTWARACNTRATCR